MKKLFFVCLFTAAGVLAASVASSTPILLDFEGLQHGEPVENYYNGGLGGFGSGPGPDVGITFGADTLALVDADAGGIDPFLIGNFANEPSPDTILFSLEGAVVMNVAAGFDSGFSFFYTNDNASSSKVNIYDDLNGTGNLVVSLDLPLTGSGPGDPSGGLFGTWNLVDVTFDGTARSVLFTATPDQIGIDNITLGGEPPQPVPEPAALLLVSIGLFGLSLFRRKFRNSI